MTTPTPFLSGYRLQDGDQLNQQIASPEWSYSDPVSATPGGTMATSTKVTTTFVDVTTASAPNAGITLPVALPGKFFIIQNSSANTITIFAEEDSTVDGYPGTVGMLLEANSAIMVFAPFVRQWIPIRWSFLITLLDRLNTWTKLQTFDAGIVSNGTADFNDIVTVNAASTFNAPVTINSQIDGSPSFSTPPVLTGLNGFVQSDGLNPLTATYQVVQTVDTIAALKAITPVSGYRLEVMGYAAVGDGGEGLFYAVTGSPAGTYVDNGGTIILPTGGDGSSAWLREHNGAALNVRWFGATGDGVTDDSAAVRLALDVVPLSGGAVYFPAGQYFIGSVVYIPQRLFSNRGTGIHIYGDRALLIGTGSGSVIFESGTGLYSTVSKGGATNWTQPPESAGSLHWGTVISDFTVTNAGPAFKLYNFVQGCAIENVFFREVFRALEAKRCFYLVMLNVRVIADLAVTASDVLILFNEFNNTLTFSGVNVSGQAVAIGMKMDNGTYGTFISNSAFEGCSTGLLFDGEIRGLSIIGCYIEGNTTGVDFGAFSKTGITVDNNWFFGNTTAIKSTGGLDAKIASQNFINTNPIIGSDLITITGAGNQLEYATPTQYFNNLTASATSWNAYPVGYTIPGGTSITQRSLIYDSTGGFDACLAYLNPNITAGGVVAFNFVGNPTDSHFGLIPYSTITNTTTPGPGTIVIDTDITYSTYNSCVRYDFTVIDIANTYQFSGVINFGNVVSPDANGAPVGKTITAAANGSGKLQITLGNFTNGIITGKARII